MKKLFLAVMMLPMMAAASDNCVLQEKNVVITQTRIDERGPIRKHVVPVPSGASKCVVDFGVRIANVWHKAYGEYTWRGDRPVSDACAIAVHRAESAVRLRVGRNHTASEHVLVCKDESRLDTLTQTVPGTMGEINQFRPHPEFPRPFYHNSTECRWFLDPVFRNHDIHTYQGIICSVADQKWVVVDRF